MWLIAHEVFDFVGDLPGAAADEIAQRVADVAHVVAVERLGSGHSPALVPLEVGGVD